MMPKKCSTGFPFSHKRREEMSVLSSAIKEMNWLDLRRVRRYSG